MEETHIWGICFLSSSSLDQVYQKPKFYFILLFMYLFLQFASRFIWPLHSSYKLRKIISVQQVADPKRGDRFLVELMLTSNRTGEDLVLAEYVYKFLEEDRLCFPEGFHWSKRVTVNVVVPVKNSGRWAFYFIRNIAGNCF